MRSLGIDYGGTQGAAGAIISDDNVSVTVAGHGLDDTGLAQEAQDVQRLSVQAYLGGHGDWRIMRHGRALCWHFGNGGDGKRAQRRVDQRVIAPRLATAHLAQDHRGMHISYARQGTDQGAVKFMSKMMSYRFRYPYRIIRGVDFLQHRHHGQSP